MQIYFYMYNIINMGKDMGKGSMFGKVVEQT